MLDGGRARGVLVGRGSSLVSVARRETGEVLLDVADAALLDVADAGWGATMEYSCAISLIGCMGWLSGVARCVEEEIALVHVGHRGHWLFTGALQTLQFMSKPAAFATSLAVLRADSCDGDAPIDFAEKTISGRRAGDGFG